MAIINDGGRSAHVTECLSRRNQLWFQLGPATRQVGSSQLLFLQKTILKLFSVGCRYCDAPGVVGC